MKRTRKKIRPIVRIGKKYRKEAMIAGAVAGALLLVGGLFLIGGPQFEVLREKKDQSAQFSAHPLTGIACENNQKRPYAVMMAADAVARPLSGIASADIVVEMPVLDDGITRFMAVFACSEPTEIGSVRSSRHDFIPLAAAFDAMYGHWGGSHFALDILNTGIIDNFDGLTNRGNPYYRKSGAGAPHNGFTSFERLEKAALALDYRQSYEGPTYLVKEPDPDEGATGATLSIKYGGSFNVDYIYSAESNRYTRFRGGIPEKDRISGSTVETSTVAVLFAASRQIEPDYNDVDITGEGRLLLFQDGRVTEGVWRKDDAPRESSLRFFDSEGKEIAFVAGPRWLQYVDTGTDILWRDESY